MSPTVRLGYDSNAGNGIGGLGWNLEFASIKRQTDKGFPEYDQADTFVYQGEELVPLNNGGQDWRCENERDFQRFRQIDSDFDSVPDSWEVTERNGTRHTLGRFRGQSGRWSVIEHPEKSSLSAMDRTYCWMLDSTTDVHGNQIQYEYLLGAGMLYPSRISYSELGGGSHEVLFEYSPRPDVFDDYRPTFSVRLDRRLTRIEVRSQGELVRAYNFGYDYLPGDLLPETSAQLARYLDLGVTLLKRVFQVDRSGDDANYLPPLVFTYSGLDLTQAELRSFSAPPELDLAEPSGRVQLADLDGDALPDLFATLLEGAGLVQRVCLNRGETISPNGPTLAFDPSRLVLGFSPVDISQTNAMVHDPQGKGLVDVSSLTDEGGNKRLNTYNNRARLDVVDENYLGFSEDIFESTLLQDPPQFVSYGDARTRQMDVNFDKRSDFIHLEPSFGAMKANLYFIRRDGEWTHVESFLPTSYPLASTFADESGQPNPVVQMADMNGDRMLDLINLTTEPSGGGLRITVDFWPVCGLGQYAEQRTMLTSEPDVFDIAGANLEDVLIEDFTGDGLADVIVLESDGLTTTLTLRVNIGGQRWSAPYTRSNLPRYQPRAESNPTVLRFADLNANGSVDLLFRNTVPQDEWTYVELLPEGKPSLLTGIDNSIGKFTTIVYDSAAEDERLAREAGKPWKTYAPIALQVVRQIRTTSGLDLNGDGAKDWAVAAFRYRDPYYDGFEREFRGFAFAQRIDYGDDYLFEELTGLMQVSSGWNVAKTPTGQVSGPSLVTRFRFHTGAADQQDNDDYGGLLPPLRLIDELTIRGGREEEPLKGLQWIQEEVDPVVLHSAPDGGFDDGALAASDADSLDDRAQLTPDAYVYTRSRQDWTVRRLYRPAEAVPYLSDQNADGVMEDYRDAPLAPIPQGRFAEQDIVVVPGDGRSVSFAYASNMVSEIREANGLLAQALGYPSQDHLRTVQSFDFDNYGNQIVARDYGIDDPAYDDERFVTTSYAHGGNAFALWIIDKPDTILTTDENGAFVAKKVHYYDGEPFVGLKGQIESRALLSRTEEFIDESQSISASRSRYDVYGNIEESLDPVGNLRRTGWDSVFKTFPTSETVVVGDGSDDLVIKAAYDYGFGVLTSAEDFNGNVTSYQYDSYARLVKIVRPGDTPELPTLAFEYQPADPVRGRAFDYDEVGNLTLASVPLGSSSRTVTRQREIPGQEGEFVTATFTDGSGKPLAAIEEGETAGTWIVKNATSYNLRLLPQSEWLPYQISSVGVPQFSAIWPAGRPPESDGVNFAIVSTDTVHDPLGRTIRTLEAPETWGGPRRETATQYLPFRLTLFDEEDLLPDSTHYQTPHIRHYDGLKRLIAVDEVVKLTDRGLPGPVTRWRTSYDYDLNDQLIRIQDSQGNIKVMEYDGLKRMTAMNDTDRGPMTFVYDDASNLRETVDAKNQRIVYTYDGANRTKTEDYQDGGPLPYDVEYYYDLPQSGLDLGDGTVGSAGQTKGQLSWVRDLSGETHFSYDARGRVEWEVTRIPDRVHGQLVSYRTRYAYDSADRLTRLTYPDGDQLTHEYNTRNLLHRIHGSALGDVIRSIAYRPSGQISDIQYGNGVVTSYAHDPRLRLISLESVNGTDQRLIDFAYSFDGASNIERIEDQRALGELPDATRRFNTQLFRYDNLYRLTHASYPVLGGQFTNSVAYQYDRIGNMLSQTSDMAQEEHGLPMVNLGSMDSGGTLGRSDRMGRNPGDPPGPHALTRILHPDSGDRVYAYDDNGNMTNADGLSSVWDFKDRLVSTENDQMLALYTYDYADRRVSKTVHWKNPGPEKGETVSELDPAWRKTSTLYIDQYFEVRDHDTWVKYVWNGETRVARITAVLGTDTLVQHLRLRAGWNQVALRVGGQFPALSPDNNPDLGACAWVSDIAGENGMMEVNGSTALPAGATLWIYAVRDTTVTVTGVAAPLALPALTGNSQFIANVLAEPININATFPDDAWLRCYDTDLERWQDRFPTALELSELNDAPMFILPGESAWTAYGTPGETGGQLPNLQVRYYHQDHLGSTAVVTDEDGGLIEEHAYYAFGYTRNQYRDAPVTEPYGFSQKERDAESGLHYFEARYLAAALGRFDRVDPLVSSMPDAWTLTPQKLNPYAYAQNRPTVRIDPEGTDDKPSSATPAQQDQGSGSSNQGAEANQGSEPSQGSEPRQGSDCPIQDPELVPIPKIPATAQVGGRLIKGEIVGLGKDSKGRAVSAVSFAERKRSGTVVTAVRSNFDVTKAKPGASVHLGKHRNMESLARALDNVGNKTRRGSGNPLKDLTRTLLMRKSYQYERLQKAIRSFIQQKNYGPDESKGKWNVAVGVRG